MMEFREWQTSKQLYEKFRELRERTAKAIERAREARRITKARKNLAALLDRKAA